MIEIEFDDGYTSGDFTFEKGQMSCYAGSGCNEMESHSGELNKDQTKRLYLAMKTYYEELEESC